MGLKEFFENMTGRLKTSTQVKNKESNNIINSPNTNSQGNNFGIETVNGDKITQFNTFNVVLNNETIGQELGSVDLEVDIKKIKEMQNYSYSLKAIEEYNKLLIVHYPKHISNDDYIKILINICYIYINRNELDNAKEFVCKLEETENNINKDVIKIKGIIAYNSKEYKMALNYMSEIKWSTDDKLEYALYQSIRCINNLITYEEFKEILVKDVELIDELAGDNNKNIYNIISITSRIKGQYEDMLLYASKAFEDTDDMYSNLQYAHSLYDYAIRESISGDRVLHDKINYQYLIESKLVCEKALRLAEDAKDMRLYKDCLVLYVNILSLLGQINEAMETLRDIKFIDDNEELINFEERLKSLYGKENTNTNVLSEVDLFLKEVFELVEIKKYDEVISKIESRCWDKYKNEVKVHCILLECYIENKEYKKFISHLRRLELNEIESNLLIKVKSRYHIVKQEYEKAERYLLESINVYRDPDTYCLLLNLYDKQEETKKFEELIKKILDEDKFVLEVEYSRIFTCYFKFLFKNNLYHKALEVLDNYCDKDKFGEQDYINASVNIYSHLGRYLDSAHQLEQLYKINSDYEALFNAANEYFRCNELDKSLNIFRNLEQKGVSFLEKVYVMISNIYVLKNELDIAYEYAEKAKELVVDIPKSEIHNFFVGRSLRCNKVDNGVIHINEFRESYPKIDNWVKSFNAIEVNDEGDEELSAEIKEFIKEHSEGFNNLLRMLREGQVGMSIVSKYRGYSINELIKWKDIYNIKVNINSGNNDEISNEISNIKEVIVIDTFILYILAEIDELEFLRNFKEIKICNSTIEYLNYLLLKEEDKNVRKILLYLDNEINIQIIYTNNYSRNDFEIEFRSAFDDFILDSVLYAKEKGYSYCYGEVFIKQLCNAIGTNSVSLVSLIRSSNYSKSYIITNKLMKQNYTFINFTYKDMYYVAKESNFKNANELDSFYKISRGADISSFIIQYIIFIYAIYYLNKESFEVYFKQYLSAMNSLYKRSYYYIFIYNTLANELYGNSRSIDKSSYLIKQPEYIRAITMQLEAMYAIKGVFTLFETEDELNNYVDLSIKIVDKKILNDTFTNEKIKSINLKEKIKEIISEL